MKIPQAIVRSAKRSTSAGRMNYVEIIFNTYFYVESQVPIPQRESDTKRPMLLRTAAIFKINLLLADIPFWIAAASFHILEAWARSLLGSRHHLIMSCK